MCPDGKRKEGKFSLIKWIEKFNIIWKKVNLWKTRFQCNSNHHLYIKLYIKYHLYIKLLNNRELMQWLSEVWTGWVEDMPIFCCSKGMWHNSTLKIKYTSVFALLWSWSWHCSLFHQISIQTMISSYSFLTQYKAGPQTGLRFPASRNFLCFL